MESIILSEDDIYHGARSFIWFDLLILSPTDLALLEGEEDIRKLKRIPELVVDTVSPPQ